MPKLNPKPQTPSPEEILKQEKTHVDPSLHLKFFEAGAKTVEPTRLVSLREIVRNRFFVIPDYQRGYSWEEEHLDDLKKDIQNLYNSDHKHYTGTIVATQHNPTHSDAFEVVDGQQRLTTLIILITQIYNTNPAKYQFLQEEFIQRGAIGAEQLVL